MHNNAALSGKSNQSDFPVPRNPPRLLVPGSRVVDSPCGQRRLSGIHQWGRKGNDADPYRLEAQAPARSVQCKTEKRRHGLRTLPGWHKSRRWRHGVHKALMIAHGARERLRLPERRVASVEMSFRQQAAMDPNSIKPADEKRASSGNVTGSVKRKTTGRNRANTGDCQLRARTLRQASLNSRRLAET